MMGREKFSTQADAALLAEMRALARADGRHLQALVEEAFADYIEARRGARARPAVMEHLKASMARNRSLYEKLAR
jgi:hypothetical protein